MTRQFDRDTVRGVVRQVLHEVVGGLGAQPGGDGTPGPTAGSTPSPGWSLPRRYLGAPEARMRTRRVLRAPDDGVRVAIGSDHGGFELKAQLCELLRERGFVPVDVGTHSPQSCDYPDFAREVGRAIQDGRATWGIMIDGAGIGSAMALNKMRGIRAATVHSEATAVNSRAHNDANVLVLGSAQMHSGHARRITRIWLETPHEGGRHAKRVAKINALDTDRS